MLFRQFTAVEDLKPVKKLPVPMAAKQIDQDFEIVEDDHVLAHGEPGDYLMQGLKGELYVCRKDVFDNCYVFIDDSNLPPHQQRVVDEKAELDDRAHKLSQFIGTNPIFETLDADEQERMKEQNDVMWQYSEILGKRIAAF